MNNELPNFTKSKLIDTIKKFCDIEYEAQLKQFNDTRDLDLDERIQKGYAISEITVQEYSKKGIFLKTTKNLSKFRIGQLLLLHHGDFKQDSMSCKLINGKKQVLQVKPTSKIPLNFKTGTSKWILDLDIFDTRSIIFAGLDEVGNSSNGDKILGIVQGKIKPEINMDKKRLIDKELETSLLNPTQKSAISNAYATRNFFSIQGPPGTGKTYLLAELAKKLALDGEIVFVTAFTHRAINNALNMIGKNPEGITVMKVSAEEYFEGLRPSIQRKDKLPKNISGGTIIGATCYAPHTSRLENLRCNTVLFDEASQISIPIAICGMVTGEKYIFFGDHKQMCPIINGEHEKKWLKLSIFELLNHFYDSIMLNINYRMNNDLTKFPSQNFYGGQLLSDVSIADKKLHLPTEPKQYQDILNPLFPNVFIEVNHLDGYATSVVEAELVASIVSELLYCGIKQYEIAVISPFRKQCSLIRDRVDRLPYYTDEMIIDTVERIQGQEKEIIIISLTLGDLDYTLKVAEFFFTLNRLNVAITRCKTKRIIVGDPSIFTLDAKDDETNEGIKIYKKLYEECKIFKV